jgi:hypothetical protein
VPGPGGPAGGLSAAGYPAESHGTAFLRRAIQYPLTGGDHQ